MFSNTNKLHVLVDVLNVMIDVISGAKGYLQWTEAIRILNNGSAIKPWLRN